MFCAGLTGGVGSGKSEAARMFSALGARVVDADAVGRDLTVAGGAGVAAALGALGDWAADAEGGLNRELVRARVFADAGLRGRLEAALHPLIRKEAARRLRTGAEGAEGGEGYAMLCAPLLLESGTMAELCDRIAVVDCAVDLQVERAMRRDGSDAAGIRRIVAAQLGREERLARADDVLENDGDLEGLRRRVAALHAKYERLAREKREKFK